MSFAGYIREFPGALQPLLQTHLAGFLEQRANAGLPPPAYGEATARALLNTWAGSDFVARLCLRDPALLDGLVADGSLARSAAAGEVRDRVVAALAEVADENALSAALRRARNREMLRIIWRDLAAGATLAETVADLSELADACIALALEKLTAWAEAESGVPTGEQSGMSQKLVVIGMGKLGACELNLSSDIDLIFAYPEEGEVVGGRRELSNHEFFTRLGRRLIKALDAVTGDGFVFRVDMRLRPWGNSGALACGFDAMESYYEEQGRPWERYALIKARICGGDLQAGEQLLKRLRPFVYRRYIDFGAFEALRELKGMIAREVRRKGMENNIKLGPGGIREVEFIAQAFQLIRGGVDTRLQERALLPVLATLAEAQVLAPAVCAELAAANDFLRRVEHRLQAVSDAQTQTLPDDDLGRLRLAFSVGFDDWPAFVAALDTHRTRVEQHFREVISLPEDEGGASGESGDEWLDLWLGRLPAPAAASLLSGSGIAADDVDGVLAALEKFRTDRNVVNMQAIARERLDRLLPVTLRSLGGTAVPATTLAHVLNVYAAVLRRSAYLVMLCEKPAALTELLRLCAASEWIADELARHPSLLDELINAGTLYAPPQLAALRADLRAQLARVPQDDIEQQMEVLRHFRLAHVLKVAASDVMETLPLMKVSDYLTWIAEALLDAVLDIAWQEMTAKHGLPGDADGKPVASEANKRFAIIGYGKLGGIELSYGSDLDLVFLYDAPADGSTDGARPLANETFYTRLVQRIVNILTTRTFSGALYEIDMRLRPSGASGLLVSSLAAFRRYQDDGAWTWEHQALVRARPVAGDAAVAEKFAAIRQDALARRRDPAKLREEVVSMRNKMVDHLGTAADPKLSAEEKAALFDLKQDPGGIIDIEFLVQYLVLLGTCEHPALARWSDNVRQLEAITSAGLLPATEVGLLNDAWLAYRARLHRRALGKQGARVAVMEEAGVRAGVRRIWQVVMGEVQG